MKLSTSKILSALSLVTISFALAACGGSGGSGGGDTLFSKQRGNATPNEINGYWESTVSGTTNSQSLSQNFYRIKIEEKRVTLGRQCAYSGSTVRVSVSSAIRKDNNTLTASSSSQASKDLKVDGTVVDRCEISIQKDDQATYTISGTSMTMILGGESFFFTKISDL